MITVEEKARRGHAEKEARRAANSEPERGVERYHELTAGEEASVAVDRLLGILEELGLEVLWAAEYDRAARDGVELAIRRAAQRARIGAG